MLATVFRREENREEATYIIVLDELDVHDQLPRLLAHTAITQATVRQALGLLQAYDDLAHDLELLPVDATSLLVADESRVTLFSRRQIAKLQRDVWDAFR